MVRGSDKTYGELMQEARTMKSPMEIGEITPQVMNKFLDLIEEGIQGNLKKGIRGKYYIHLWTQKTPYAQNSIHLYCQTRRTRPSPYQGNDHYLWSVEHGDKIKFEWCIPKIEMIAHILQNPHEFSLDYVILLKDYLKDKLEKIEDYLVDGKVI